ncbi:hypothetical protein GUITHDRAFT_150704 [Guillardia theta CCMP2712]|uniref:Transmembrane protein n=2 Tax=Guillardia theta TaxID=55529 RepID=L1JV20_GUITC|nr:hypothetical protein GUITHDRAFT_150704 [Guillardia theta CCMP2712]EKX52169.1 hypothetical protein GUITHDRAFT_150704 [Guillardia theta CCMP2712]|mmetsp:Transcript_8629/g.28781  ORF Transcript_8629/g.28781 Transcript_8629/m.28781 type:complete len:144 (+) Transcript_8629:77-508(+)|eukprot:XP_005839149.1 hypothetical protein GUITHDRAFT_150704 [Guillardia theta CCMP2712]
MGSDNRDKVDFLSKSSLPLQILIFFNGCYSTLFFLVTLALLIWKGVEFPYPAGRLPWEIILLFVYIVVEACRLFIGSKGNKTENWPMILMLIILSCFSALANVFYINFQTYVLRLDLIFNSISFAFVGLEIIFGIFSIVRFAK